MCDCCVTVLCTHTLSHFASVSRGFCVRFAWFRVRFASVSRPFRVCVASVSHLDCVYVYFSFSSAARSRLLDLRVRPTDPGVVDLGRFQSVGADRPTLSPRGKFWVGTCRPTDRRVQRGENFEDRCRPTDRPARAARRRLFRAGAARPTDRCAHRGDDNCGSEVCARCCGCPCAVLVAPLRYMTPQRVCSKAAVPPSGEYRAISRHNGHEARAETALRVVGRRA